jgi:hypothetical protein
MRAGFLWLRIRTTGTVMCSQVTQKTGNLSSCTTAAFSRTLLLAVYLDKARAERNLKKTVEMQPEQRFYDYDFLRCNAA